MKSKIQILSGIFSLLAAGAPAQTTPVDYVNPLMGTLSKFELSTGNTYPAIARPWGMNFWTPQTGKMGNGWTYVYTADKICGLKQTHQPSPWINDYGQFSIMPLTGKPVFDQNERASWFSHKAETAKPYYYRVYLADHDVTAEITPTDRAAMFRFTFPENTSYVVVDAFDRGSYVKIIPERNRIIGYTTRNSGGVPDNFRNYFVIEFDRPFRYHAAVADGEIRENSVETEADHAGAIVGFETGRGDIVNVRVASSFIGYDQAELNLRELGNRNFDEIAAEGRAVWNDILGRIAVEDADTDRLRTFYSCLYRSVLFPRRFYEFDAQGDPVHYSPYNGKVLPGYLFTDTGFWDTFRCLFPFLNLVYPSMSEKMQEGLVNAFKESGFLPEWASPGHRGCMIGNNSASIVADAWVKGIRGYDIETLWEALEHGTNHVHPKVSSTGRLGWQHYNDLGYVPDDVNIRHNAARTLEYAYNDWAIFTLGRLLGKPTPEIDLYRRRAMNYTKVYNPKYRLMSGRIRNGDFDPEFNPADWSNAFCEGNSWHWSFCVFHDPQGLIDLMGGEREFNAMMDSVFVIPGHEGLRSRRIIHEMREMQVMDMGQYAHGNQPIQHMAYLYNYSGEPWKTQYRVREIMDKLYSSAPDGYCGDEDNGQTSAWYVFSALGFYPVCPGTDEYIIGSPLFREIKISLENGKKIRIIADGNSPRNRFIAAMKLNGRRYDRTYLRHGDLTKGAHVRFRMSARPHPTRGTAVGDRPYSFSNEEKEAAAD